MSLVVRQAYLKVRLRALLLSEFLETDFQMPLLAISSEMFTSDGSLLSQTHTR